MIRLLPGSEEMLASWYRTLNERMSEARASIRIEGVIAESWFESTMGEYQYVIGLMRKSTSGTNPPAQAKSGIDDVHTRFKRLTWDRAIRVPTTLMYDANDFGMDVPGMIVLRTATLSPADTQAASRTLKTIDRHSHSAISVFLYDHVDRHIIGVFVRATTHHEASELAQACIDAIRACGIPVMQERSAETLLDVQAHLEDD